MPVVLVSLNYMSCSVVLSVCRWKAAMELAEQIRDAAARGAGPAPTGRYQSPHLNAQIFPTDRVSAVTEVMMSSQLNAQTHTIVVRTLLDHLRHMKRLVDAYNATASSSVAPQDITHSQLNALGSLRDDINEKGAPRVFSQNKFKVFHFCAVYGIDVLHPSSVAFVTGRKMTDKHTFDLIPATWLLEALQVVKDRSLPTQRWLANAKSKHPFLAHLPSLAEFIITRLTYCRDTTFAKKTGVNKLPEDDPCFIKSVDGVPRIVEHAVAVYLQWIKVLGQLPMHIWARPKKFSASPVVADK